MSLLYMGTGLTPMLLYSTYGMTEPCASYNALYASARPVFYDGRAAVKLQDLLKTNLYI